MKFHIVCNTEDNEGVGVFHARTVDHHGWDFMTFSLLFSTLNDLSHKVPEPLRDTKPTLDLDDDVSGLHIESPFAGDGDAACAQDSGNPALNALPARRAFLPPRLGAFLAVVQ